MEMAAKPAGKSAGGKNKGGRPKGRAPKRALLLVDLRYVYKSKDGTNDTPGQATLRKLFADNPKEFLNQLRQAEGQYREDLRRMQLADEKAKGEDGGAAEEMDAGTGKALEIIGRLIDEYEGGAT